MRRLCSLILAVALLPAIWLRDPVAPLNDDQAIAFVPVPLPALNAQRANLGPFRLEGIWEITSRNSHFGGLSGLVALGDGRLLSVSDQGRWLSFSPPGAPPSPTRIAWTRGGRLPFKSDYDAEAVTRDPATGRIWIAWETTNSISRHDPDMRLRSEVRPGLMRDWGRNGGPEALVRLRDGRFVVLREAFSGRFEIVRHQALVFPGDPIVHRQARAFSFSGPARFSPTDMAQMPDGRVLVLMRRLVWPLPYRFAGHIALADPAEIRPGGEWPARSVARLSSGLPVDNFEGIAIEPGAPGQGGRLTVWLLADDNNAASQRSLLWKLSVDPSAL